MDIKSKLYVTKNDLVTVRKNKVTLRLNKPAYVGMYAGLDKFTFTWPIFGGRNFICTPDRARKETNAQIQSQCARLIKKQLETVIFVHC